MIPSRKNQRKILKNNKLLKNSLKNSLKKNRKRLKDKRNSHQQKNYKRVLIQMLNAQQLLSGLLLMRMNARGLLNNILNITIRLEKPLLYRSSELKLNMLLRKRIKRSASIKRNQKLNKESQKNATPAKCNSKNRNLTNQVQKVLTR